VSPEEFTQLIESYRHEFYSYIHKQLWDKSLCDDIFSQSMMTAWEKRMNFEKGSNFRAWVYQIITYKCYTANKQKHRQGQVSLEDLHEDFEPEDTFTPAFQGENWIQDCDEAIPKALGELQDKERSCLLLRAMGNYSYKEISEMVSIPMGTVMTHLHRARKKMQKHLKDYLESPQNPKYEEEK
jgi:RNA polymerase sigma-70 factor (ECF subfamily)